MSDVYDDREHMKKFIAQLQGSNARLRAENERLRDMLEYIAEHDPDKRELHGELIDVLRSAVASAKVALVFPDPLHRPDPPKENSDGAP